VTGFSKERRNRYRLTGSTVLLCRDRLKGERKEKCLAVSDDAPMLYPIPHYSMNFIRTLAMVGLVGVGMVYGEDAPKKKVVVDSALPKGWTDPLNIVKRDGQLKLSDGSSTFIFYKDGKFQSFPVGQSGRTLSGKWTYERTGFTAVAKADWMNGFHSNDDYRKIVFIIYPTPSEHIDGAYQGYFYIDELNRISKEDFSAFSTSPSRTP